jgi:hypothetical protein
MMVILPGVKMKKAAYITLIIVLAMQIVVSLHAAPAAYADTTTIVRPIVFPVLGGGTYSNDFYSSRSDGIHHATDIFNYKFRELVAVMDGVVTSVVSPQASWGYSITIRDDAGYNYRYIHMNNDNPGTDDGAGGEMHAYAQDMRVGNRVVQGQHIGYLGDSGNAETTSSHLHFEMYDGNNQYINPFYSLNSAPRLNAVVQYPQLKDELLPYGDRPLGVNVAMGNFDSDPALEYITGVAAGGGPHVRMFDSNNAPMAFSQYVFDPNFQGGVDVAAGDFDGDGVDEIIVGAGAGAGPHVRVLKVNGQVMAEFYAYDPSFKGGITVAAGDIDGDGSPEIITGAGPGGSPEVRAFKITGAMVSDLLVYAADFRGGVDVAAGDVIGDSKAEIVTASGAGEPGMVRVLDKNGNEQSRINAYSSYYYGGVRVSVGNVKTSTSKSEILTVPKSAGEPHTAMFNGAGTQILDEAYFKEAWWLGYNDIAAGFNSSLAATGVNRRASVKKALD